jgi:PmbA protein
MPLDPSELGSSLRASAAHAIDLARSLGATQSEVAATADEGLTVTVRMGEIESVERHGNRGLGITVYRDGSKGSASTTDFSAAGIDAVVRKALSIAGFTEADTYAGLADAALMATDSIDLDLFHPWPLDVAAAEALALRTENAARGRDARIANSEGASVATETAYRVYANSHGFIGGYPYSAHSISCSIVAKNDAGLERDYWVTSARVPTALEPPEHVGHVAADRALRRLGSRQIATRTVPVLYPPELARGLFGHLVSAIRGTSQYRRASFLLDAKGEQLFPASIDIDEDPHIPRAFGSVAFDSDGVATRPRRLVDAGRLTGYVLSAYSARRLGLVTTANAGGIHNLSVAPTAGTQQEILAGLDRVFVVGELLGQGVNTVTGDYSRGAAGFWVEHGEIVHAVSEVTIAGNLREMYQNIAAVGSDVDTRGVVRCGSVLIDAMTVAGQ